jgi:plastocyanin
VFNTASKLQYGFAAAALVLAVVYGIAIEDPTGFVRMLGIFVAFTLAAMAVSAAGASDRAPVYRSLEDAPPLQTIVVDRSAMLPPNPWPFIGAVAAGTLAVGAAVDVTVVVVGIIACLIAASGWFAQAWREDPSYTPREGERISERLIGPFGLPTLALALIGVIIISLSRVLLAVPKHGSVIVAIAVAAVVLAVFFMLSARPRLSRSTIGVLAGFSVVALVAAGSVSAANGYRTFEKHEAVEPTKETAKNLAFNVKDITVKAGQTATITFDNLDGGTYHNIAVYTANPGGSPIWTGEPIKGVRKITYTNVFPTVGKYAFRCDFHATTMLGTFNVVNP